MTPIIGNGVIALTKELAQAAVNLRGSVEPANYRGIGDANSSARVSHPCYSAYVSASERPLHVVAADNAEAQETIVITVYEPDPDQWEAGFTRRKR